MNALMRWTNGDVATSQDLMQETFMTAWIKRRHLTGVEDLRAWLITVAFNKWRNHWRKYGKRKAEHFDPSTMDHLQPAAAADSFVQYLVFDGKSPLSALSTTDREVLSLKYLEDLDDKVVARVLGISEVAARQRLSRARTNARRLLDRSSAGEGGSNDARRR